MVMVMAMVMVMGVDLKQLSLRVKLEVIPRRRSPVYEQQHQQQQ